MRLLGRRPRRPESHSTQAQSDNRFCRGPPLPGGDESRLDAAPPLSATGIQCMTMPPVTFMAWPVQ
jgi:hypothetical protein